MGYIAILFLLNCKSREYTTPKQTTQYTIFLNYTDEFGERLPDFLEAFYQHLKTFDWLSDIKINDNVFSFVISK